MNILVALYSRKHIFLNKMLKRAMANGRAQLAYENGVFFVWAIH